MGIEKLNWYTGEVDRETILQLSNKIDEIIECINYFEKTGLFPKEYKFPILTNVIAEETGPKGRGVFHNSKGE